jgi:hypothetical protein
LPWAIDFHGKVLQRGKAMLMPSMDDMGMVERAALYPSGTVLSTDGLLTKDNGKIDLL